MVNNPSRKKNLTQTRKMIKLNLCHPFAKYNQKSGLINLVLLNDIAKNLTSYIIPSLMLFRTRAFYE